MLEPLNVKQLLSWHSINKEKSLNGRYITLDTIAPLYADLPLNHVISKVGLSVNGLPIHTLTFGNGPIKILMWSQMHGNESTTTKAVFDLIKSFVAIDCGVGGMLEELTICVIPMLNPDGAVMFTRENAANVDLNRDAQELSQPESMVLRTVIDRFKPDYCFNLHGQRTIYGFSNTGKSSVMSFLAPSADSSRSITLPRKRAMSIICEINEKLSSELPGQIGRYDDAFNLNCTGDTFVNEGIPVVLFEAGHYPNDYKREVTRSYVFVSILIAFEAIINKKEVSLETYFDIPEHEKCFSDIVVRNANIGDVCLQFEEKLRKSEIHFNAVVVKIGPEDKFLGHYEIDAKYLKISKLNFDLLKIGDAVKEFDLINMSTITLS